MISRHTKSNERQAAEIEELKKKAAEIDALKKFLCSLSPFAEICGLK